MPRRPPPAPALDVDGEVLHRSAAWTITGAHLVGGRGVAVPVVVKRPRRPGLHTTALLRAEAAVARSARHHRLVRARVVDVDGEPTLCLAPRCAGRLADLGSTPLSAGAVTGLVRDAARALAALHGAGWVHGRVDGDHLLVGPDGRAVVAGLGRSRRAAATTTGGPEVRAPTPADDVAALARVATALLDPGDPVADGLGPVLARMAHPDPAARPAAATAADLAVRFGPPPLPLVAPPPPPGPSPAGADRPPPATEYPAPVGRTPSTAEPAGPTLRSPPATQPSGAVTPRVRGSVILLAAGGALSAVVGIGVVAAGGSTEGTPVGPAPCPRVATSATAPGPVAARADVDGRGCTVPVRWSAEAGTLEVATAEGVRRYEVGRPGDRLVLGDWDCDGAATPLLVRPGEAVGWRWDTWPADGEEAQPVAVPLDGVGGDPPAPHCP